jgi:hypothetical protein
MGLALHLLSYSPLLPSLPLSLHPGWCDAPITFLFQNVVSSQWVWLAAFLLLTFGGIAGVAKIYLPVFAWVMEGKGWEGAWEGAAESWSRSSML